MGHFSVEEDANLVDLLLHLSHAHSGGDLDDIAFVILPTVTPVRRVANQDLGHPDILALDSSWEVANPGVAICVKL